MTRAWRDEQRERITTNASLFATRQISYTSSVVGLPISLEALISENDFNKDLPEDKKTNTLNCRNLKLASEPTKTDTILYDGKTYIVREFTKIGTMYNVVAENAKRNKVTSRNFK